jgi:hypothetical protein
MTLSYLPLTGQPIPGPHPGEGRLEVADKWLEIKWEVDDENDAAAAPATTIANTKTRIASFIIGYPLNPSVDTMCCPTNTKDSTLEFKVSPSFSYSSISSHHFDY